MPYIGNQPGTGVRNRFIYTATASQTTFSGADDNGKTLKYADSDFVDVFLNGICLVPVTDYTSTSKTSIVLTQAASLNDTLEVVAYDIATISDTVSKADGGTFNGNVTFADGADIITASKGTNNARVGLDAGKSIASGGNYNTLVGDFAGDALTTGDSNTAVGYGALSTEDADGKNTAIGFEALNVLNAGADGESVAVGYQALKSQTTGVSNVAVGYLAGEDLTTGTDNTFIGTEAGKNTTDRNHNTVVGNQAFMTNVNGAKNVALGSGALLLMNPASDSDTYNVAVGYDAGGQITTAASNTIVGGLAGDALTTGSLNTFVGTAAGSATDDGASNTAVGAYALDAGNALTSGTSNTFVGGEAGDATDDGIQNVAVGYQALSANCDNGNTAVGVESLKVCTGYHNTAIGLNAGKSVTSGGNMLFLGKDSGLAGSPGGAHTTGTNSVVIGDENIANIYAQVSVTATLNLGLDFVNNLSPVTYKWDRRIHYADKTESDWRETVDLDKLTNDGTHKDDDLQVGFKAQEVIALEEAAGYKLSDETNLTATQTHDGKQFGLRYERFVPILTKAIQELSAKVDALETENTAIKSRLAALEAG
jgi:hypothetical protein